MSKFLLFVALALAISVEAFTVPRCSSSSTAFSTTTTSKVFGLRMSEQPEAAVEEEKDPMEEQEMDDATRIQMEKIKRSDELRAQEVFMTKSTGKYQCTNCDWEYDEEKGDSMMIGGQIKPGTSFEDLPSNWRCPVCRASKDSFQEKTEEIAGFEVNQGYGFGGNAMTGGQKNLIIFGGLGFLFILLLGGYGLN